MSAKNKAVEKKLRKMRREDKVCVTAGRVGTTDIPLEVSRDPLTNPKQKMSSGQRKHFFRSREAKVEVEQTDRLPHATKLQRKLRVASITRVIRCMNQAVRRTLRAAKALGKLHPESKFRAPIEVELHRQREIAFVAHTEVERRMEKCNTPLRSCVTHKKRVKPTPFEQEKHPSGLSGEHSVVLDAIHSECLHSV